MTAPRRPRSAAETLLAAQLEQAGIPFEREFAFAQMIGRRWRSDFVIGTSAHERYVAALLIEVDGGSWVAGRHNRGAGFAADCEKLNAAAELGYRVLRYVPAQIESGEALEQIRRILSMKEDRAA